MVFTENRRIFWNIVFTYGRSLISIGGMLLISRWVLMALGQVDFGLFSVVGGLVVFIQFTNNVLAGATTRFYAFAIGEAKSEDNKNGLEVCKKWFNTAISIHTLLPLLLILIGYPIGKWAIVHWLTIPPDRIYACIWVLRFTCISSLVAMVNVPFTAMYNAKQYIAELTIYSMIATLCNVIFAYYMASHPGLWLTKYALWMCLVTIVPQIIICIRAIIIFQECKLVVKYLWDKIYIRTLLSFAGWQFLGAFCSLLRSQGITLLINKVFGPIINASMQIANQVNAGTSTLASALIVSFSPAITTACGAKDYKRMMSLAFGACKFSTLLALIFVIPLALELPYVINLWLKTPPPFVIGLCYLMLTYYICDVCTTGNVIVINASGKIKEYHIVLSGISIFTLPAAIFAVYLGGNVYSIAVILVIAIILNSAGRVYFAQKLLNMSAKHWTKEIMFPICSIIFLCAIIAYLPHLLFPAGFMRLFITVMFSECLFIPLAWFVVLNTSEREYILTKIKSIRKNKVSI